MERSSFASNEKRKHVVFCAQCEKGKGDCNCRAEIIGLAVTNSFGVTHGTFTLGPGRVIEGGEPVALDSYGQIVEMFSNGVPIGTVTSVTPGPQPRNPITESVPFNVSNVEIYSDNFRAALGYDTLEELLEDTGMERASMEVVSPDTDESL